MTQIRKATPADIDIMMAIYDEARSFMRSNGNMTQWANGYPSRETVMKDIADGVSHLICDADGVPVAVFAFILGEDPTYAVISDGAWLNNEAYGTIHRIASDGSMGGILKSCVDYCMTQTDNLRLDTHADNRPMQAAAERLGFRRCGIIICSDGTPRTAYHLVK